MGNNRLVRIIIPIITAIVSIIAMVVAAFFVVHAIKDSSKDLEKEKERIEIEYQELGEENTDPETGKTILTEKFLAKDYQKYYAGKKSSNTLMRNIILIFVLGFVAIGMLSSIADSIMAISKGRGIRVRSIITAIVVVALVIAGMYVFKKIIAMKMPPELDRRRSRSIRSRFWIRRWKPKPRQTATGTSIRLRIIILSSMKPGPAVSARSLPTSIMKPATLASIYSRRRKARMVSSILSFTLLNLL